MLLRSVKTIWFNRQFRLGLVQVLFAVILIIVFSQMWLMLKEHLADQDIAVGFDFLHDTAGFSIIMHLIQYNEQSSYGRAFFVGLLNTLLVSGIGIIIATILGFIIGIARLATNKIFSTFATLYVETIRNIPLLLQIFFWYFAVLRTAPLPAHSISIFNKIFITNRGIYFPTLNSVPVLNGLNFEGGVVLLPEFLALVIALSIYTASYIAETVRLGILAVSKTQKEAAITLGLSNWQILKLVIIPQALKVVLPPLTNQYLNLTKNSSLAVAIGYPDLVGVFAGTVLNQSGHAIEIILMTMAVYLSISLSISGLMLIYERSTK